MFIKTGNLEISNLLQYRKIAVVENQIRIYLPIPSTEGGEISDRVTEGYPIHTFEKNVDAEYALYNLFVSQNAGINIWDPCSVEPVSAIWNKVNQYFEDRSQKDNNSRDIRWEFLRQAVISDFGLSKITIAYNRICDRQLRYNIDDCKKKVEVKLREILESPGISLTFEWNAIANIKELVDA